MCVSFQCVSKSTQAVARCPKLSECFPIAPKILQTFQGVPRNVEVFDVFQGFSTVRPRNHRFFKISNVGSSDVSPNKNLALGVLTVLYELVKVDRTRGFAEGSSRVHRCSPRVPPRFSGNSSRFPRVPKGSPKGSPSFFQGSPNCSLLLACT
jgi:hypothetical protein